MITDFEKIYQMYYMQVYSYVMTLVKNADVAEEITQQTFFNAISGKSKFKGQSGEVTWLCAIAKNLVVDEFRKTAKSVELPEEVACEVDFYEGLEKRETSLQIHLLLHKLTEPYKEVFQLRIFGDLSFADIGKIFGKSENWARVTYHRAKLKIQERMDENGK